MQAHQAGRRAWPRRAAPQHRQARTHTRRECVAQEGSIPLPPCPPPIPLPLPPCPPPAHPGQRPAPSRWLPAARSRLGPAGTALLVPEEGERDSGTGQTRWTCSGYGGTERSSRSSWQAGQPCAGKHDPQGCCCGCRALAGLAQLTRPAALQLVGGRQALVVRAAQLSSGKAEHAHLAAGGQGRGGAHAGAARLGSSSSVGSRQEQEQQRRDISSTCCLLHKAVPRLHASCCAARTRLRRRWQTWFRRGTRPASAPPSWRAPAHTGLQAGRGAR